VRNTVDASKVLDGGGHQTPLEEVDPQPRARREGVEPCGDPRGDWEDRVTPKGGRQGSPLVLAAGGGATLALLLAAVSALAGGLSGGFLAAAGVLQVAVVWAVQWQALYRGAVTTWRSTLVGVATFGLAEALYQGQVALGVGDLLMSRVPRWIMMQFVFAPVPILGAFLLTRFVGARSGGDSELSTD